MLRFVLFGYHETTYRCCQFLLNKGARVLYCYPRTRKIPLFKNSAIAYYAFDAITDPDMLEVIHKFNADYIFSMVCGEKVPADVVRLCRYYALNFHPAPLPQCRTANAWFWPLRLGYAQSAVTVHLLADRFDTGDIVYERKFPIDPMDNQRTYAMAVIEQMRHAVDEVFALIRTGQIRPKPQSGNGHYYGRLKVHDICIDWEQSNRDVHNLIRACNPTHPAVTHYKDNLLGILEAFPTGLSPRRPGEQIIKNNHLYCSCGDGVLDLTVFQFNGILSARRLIEVLSTNSGERFTPSTQVESISKILDRDLGRRGNGNS